KIDDVMIRSRLIEMHLDSLLRNVLHSVREMRCFGRGWKIEFSYFPMIFNRGARLRYRAEVKLARRLTGWFDVYSLGRCLHFKSARRSLVRANKAGLNHFIVHACIA